MPRGRKPVQAVNTVHCEKCNKEIAARGFKAHQTWHRKQEGKGEVIEMPANGAKPAVDLESYRTGFKDGWATRGDFKG
jgi:hypothetical protein